MKAPVVNARRHMVKPRANVNGQLVHLWLELLRIGVVVSYLSLRIPEPQGIKDRSAKLRQHSQPFAPTRPP